MLSITRRATLSAFALLVLAACGNANGDDASHGGAARNAETGLPDMVLGDPDAPVTLVEYASVTCPHCADFHATVMPVLKEEYIETGKVKFIFREFPTAPQNVAIAGFALARCTGPENYYDVLDDLFENQMGILSAARNGTVISALRAVGERHGINGEQEFNACIDNSAIREDIADIILSGDDYNVSATPTLILQGHRVEGTVRTYTADGLSSLIDLELAALGYGESAPEPAAEDTPETPATDGGVDSPSEQE